MYKTQKPRKRLTFHINNSAASIKQQNHAAIKKGLFVYKTQKPRKWLTADIHNTAIAEPMQQLKKVSVCVQNPENG